MRGVDVCAYRSMVTFVMEDGRDIRGFRLFLACSSLVSCMAREHTQIFLYLRL